jgi:hypothetical protein
MDLKRAFTDAEGIANPAKDSGNFFEAGLHTQ